MFDVWLEDLTDSGNIDRHPVKSDVFDLNSNLWLENTNMNPLAEQLRKDIHQQNRYPVGTVITYLKKYHGKGTPYHYAAVWSGRKWYTTGQADAPMTAEQMTALLAGDDVTEVLLVTQFESVKE